MPKPAPYSLRLLIPAIGFLTLSACGGGSTDSAPPPPPIINDGYLVDSQVQGLTYTSGGQKGISAADGHMRYQVGKNFNVKLGRVTVGNATSAEIITPLDFVRNTHTGHLKVQNIARFLTYLDDDATIANGIQINDNLQADANDWTVRFSPNTTFLSDIDTYVTDAIAIYNANTQPLPSPDQITRHLNASTSCAYSGAYSGSYEETSGTTNNGEWRFFVKRDGTILAYTKAPDEMFRHTGTRLYDATTSKLKPVYFDPATDLPVLDDNGDPSFDLSTKTPVMKTDHSAEIKFDQDDYVTNVISYGTEMIYSGRFDATHRHELSSSSTLSGITFIGKWDRSYNVAGSPSSQNGTMEGSKVGTYVNPLSAPVGSYTYYRGILETSTYLGEISIAIAKNTGDIVARTYEVSVTGTLADAEFVETSNDYSGTTTGRTLDSNGVVLEGTVSIGGNTGTLTNSNPADPLGSAIITGNWGDGKFTACKEVLLPRP